MHHLDIWTGGSYRDKEAARRYFEKANDQKGVPGTVTIDNKGANLAALETINAGGETPMKRPWVE